VLVKGDNGVFDVVADGKLLFSKHARGRFPEDTEILAALRA
jgi:predicted Rdx family selenoprotein